MKKKQYFSKKEAIQEGWTKTINNLGFFIGLIFLVWILTAGPGFISEKLGDNFPLTSLLLVIIGAILSIIVDMGLIKIGIDFVEKSKSKIKELFSQYQKFLIYLGGMILYGLIIIGGLILLIIPGIIWAVQFQFVGYFIVDKKKGPIEALKESSKITKGKKWDLFLFNILLILINLLGLLTFGIGMVITAPTTQIAMAHVYKKLS